MAVPSGIRMKIAWVIVLALISVRSDSNYPVWGAYMDGNARLVSSEPLPNNDVCTWDRPGISPVPSSAAWAREQQSAGLTTNGRTQDFSQRKPVRMIRDPYPSYSGIAVDHKNNEVIITDQNLFQILVYDRLANSPASDLITKPKRVLGGEKTEIEFQSGLYVDPENGDIYAGNNDTVNKLVVFSRALEGDVAPTRELHTPDGRTFGIDVNEAKREMYLVIQKDDAIAVYPKSAQKDDGPIRLLQGERTRLADPHGIALDIANNLMFVTNYGARTKKQQGRTKVPPNTPLSGVVPGSGRFDPPSITVYSMDAVGDTPPLRIIQGPKAGLNWATGIALDPGRKELFVANDMGDEILVFDSSAQGDVAPKRILKGPKSAIKNPMDVYVDLQHNELWVTNFGNHSATVHKLDATGDTPPLRTIRSGPAAAPAPMMGNPHPIAYDTIRDQLLVPN